MEEERKHTKHFESYPFINVDEIRHLWETGKYVELDKLVAEKTTENTLLSILKREDVSGFDILNNQDVLERVLLNMDIVQLGQMAPKIPEVAQILKNPKFWERKLEIDVPELFEELGYNVRRGNDVRFNGVLYPFLRSKMPENANPKSIYLVLKFFAWKLRKAVVKNHAPEYFYDNYKISFRLKREEKETSVSEIESILQFKKYPYMIRTIPFFEMFRYPKGSTVTLYKPNLNSPISNYIYFVCESLWRRTYSSLEHNTLNIAPGRGHVMNTERPDVFFARLLREFQETTLGRKDGYVYLFKHANLKDLVAQGYADKNDQGIILVGCQTCNSLDLKSQLECCPHVAYCSHECAYEDWKQHLELHH